MVQLQRFVFGMATTLKFHGSHTVALVLLGVNNTCRAAGWNQTTKLAGLGIEYRACMYYNAYRARFFLTVHEITSAKDLGLVTALNGLKT